MQITIAAKLTEREQEHEDFKALKETGFYGRMGAGSLIFCSSTKRYLLALRSGEVEQPGTWGIIGGALKNDEKPLSAVRREMKEELGLSLRATPRLIYIFKSKSFSYFNYLVTVSKEFTPICNWETERFEWFSRDDFPTPLHFGVIALIDNKAF